MSSRMDCPIIVLQVTRPPAEFIANIPAISGSVNLAPAGISSRLHSGRSGDAGGSAMPLCLVTLLFSYIRNLPH